MEVLRYFGRDVNLIELWDKFKEIHAKAEVDPNMDEDMSDGASAGDYDINEKLGYDDK
jgi:hypothetical protein